MFKLLRHALKDLSGTVASAEEESRFWLASRPLRKMDLRLVGLVCLACACLAILEYYGASSDWDILAAPLSLLLEDAEMTKVSELLEDVFRRSERAELWRLGFWAGMTFVFYFIVPALWIWIVERGRLRDYGLRGRGVVRHAWIYVALYLAVMPFVVAVATTESFQNTYPFYDDAHRSLHDFLMWQCFYLLQFFSLEFFFRGFLIHGTRRRFGYYAILFSVVPYSMIHFGKPLPETLGAILAGLVLGALSIRTRSIWLGVAIHVSVAVSMDILSMALKGDIPAPW